MTAVDFVHFVEKLADVSGDAILPFFRTSLGTEDKSQGGAFDPVTEADRAAESAMRQLITSTFPAHGIIGEEFGNHHAEAEYVWVLDPIDGTRSFISGLPVWGTLIGLKHNGRPVYGMMHQPFTRERFTGDGEGARWMGINARGTRIERSLRTRSCTHIANATLMTTSPLLFPPQALACFQRIQDKARLTRYGGDCYAYCMLASGHVDLVIENGLQPYDIVALVPIVEGAGGIVTTWNGEDPANGGAIVAAGDRRIHEEVIALLRD